MANEPLKDINEDAEAKKKMVVNRIIWGTMGDLKKAFLLWHQETNIIDDALKIKFLFNFMENLNLVACSNIAPALN